MIQSTTPTVTITVEGIDLTPYDVVVSLRQYIRQTAISHAVDIEYEDIALLYDGTDTEVTFTLTQEQTGGFRPGTVNAQVNYGNGTLRMGTHETTLTVERNLMNNTYTFGSATDPDTSADAATATTDGTVTYVNVTDGSITTAKIADGAVTADKLAEGILDIYSVYLDWDVVGDISYLSVVMPDSD